MRTICKYNINITNSQTISLPSGSKLLDIQVLGSCVCLWAEIETESENPSQQVTIECFGTGHTMSEDMGIDRTYIATIQKDNLVWHFYNRLN